MLACTALVGCTNEDVVNNEQENQNGSNAYMAVRLVMADSYNSRAAEDGGYNEGLGAEGEPSEQKIDGTKSIFLFYDGSGKYVTSGQLLTQTDFSEGEPGNHHGNADINDLKGEAYVVLSSPTEAIKNTIRQVLTVVNYSGKDDLKYKTKDQALTTIVEAEKDPANAGFVMSTSVYHDGTNVVNTTSILGTQQDAQGNFLPLIFDTQEEAKGNPVVIHIERASAKVQLTYGTNKTVITESTEVQLEVEGSEAEDDENTTEKEDENDEAGGQEGNDITIDGVQYPVYIKIEGWTVNNVNETSYLVKSVDAATWNSTNPLLNNISWNNANDYRSYWANGTKYDITATEGNGLVAYTYNEAADATYTNSAMYCYEQTIENPTSQTAMKGVKYPNVTTVLIAATIQTKASSTAEPAAVGNLYEYGGIYYTETGLKNLILKNMSTQYYTKGTKEVDKVTTNADGSTTTTKETVDAYYELGENDLDIKTDGTLAGVTITVKDGTYYTVAGEGESLEATEVTDNKTINDAIEATGYTDVQGYQGGKCYYQIPIEHLSSQKDADKTYLYGVVRNHWYKLNISKVIRIGEPVYNPGVEIPEIPAHDKNYYMAAELHVLNWHVVEQDVTLD